MTRYLVRRLAQAIVVIFVVLTAVFFAVQVIGDPARLMLPPDASAEQLEQLRTQLGLSEPVLERFVDFMTGAIQGDFGDSLNFGESAMALALKRLPATLLLSGSALLIAFVVGVPLGILAAVKQASWMDKLVNILSLTAVSVVEFWIALLLIYVFAVELGWLPTSGYGSVEYLVLPAVVLALRPMGRLAQFTRAALAEELAKPYIRAANARGIGSRRVTVHALKNVSVPLATVTGDELIHVVSATVPVEIVFAWPGLGSLMLSATTQRDLPLIEACVVVYALLVVGVNLFVDLTYGVLDRRARVVPS